VGLQCGKSTRVWGNESGKDRSYIIVLPQYATAATETTHANMSEGMAETYREHYLILLSKHLNRP
jgi:hypothetical protein